MSGAHLAGAVPELVGVNPSGPVLSTPVHLEIGSAAVPVSGPWQPVRPRDAGTAAWRCGCSGDEPARDRTEHAAITIHRLGSGMVAAVHAPIFTDYFRRHAPLLRRLVSELLAAFDIGWTVETDAPPYLEIALREKEGQFLVNLINRGALEALSPTRTLVTEIEPVRDVRLRIRRPERPAAVHCEPDRKPVAWEYRDGVVTVLVSTVPIHEIVVVSN